MLSPKAKELFAKLEMEYPPIAVKFSYGKPEGIPHQEEVLSLCQFVQKAQVTGKGFYITASNENCFGRMVLGMVDKPPFAASGQAGVDFGVFASPAPNARLYTQIETLTRGSVNFVSFVPVADCDFDPDLVICVANTEQAGIILRATSYYSGDLWESKESPVLSCAWLFAYPYVTNKVNSAVTGMGHGMMRRKVYPAGLHFITIPYGKIGEVVRALDEMVWHPIALSDDPADQAEMARRMDNWKVIEASGLAECGGSSESIMPQKG